MNPASKPRDSWLDAAKGLTISLVALHHVYVGVRDNMGVSPAFDYWYGISISIRMPIFFLMAGLFALKSATNSRRDFVDSKILHFSYLYVIWGTIYFALRGGLEPSIQASATNLLASLGTGGAIWFLYSLSLSFVLLRLTRNIPPYLQISFFSVVAATIVTTSMDSQNIVIKTLRLYPFFLIGAYSSTWIRDYVSKATWRRTLFFALALMTAYLCSGAFDLRQNAISFFTLALLGAGCILGLLYLNQTTLAGRALALIGKNSLYVYLMHFVPAAGFRILALKLGISSTPFIIIVGTMVAIASPIIIHSLVARTSMKFLFYRPNWLRLG